MTIWVNDSTGDYNSTFTSWDYKVLEINQTFQNTTIEGAIEDFFALIRVKPTLTISAIALVYNGTATAGESSEVGENTEIKKLSFIIPQVAADTNISFNWSILLSDGKVINLTTKIQEVINLGMDNCLTFTNQILNLSMVDEEEQFDLVPPINTTLEIAIVPHVEQ